MTPRPAPSAINFHEEFKAVGVPDVNTLASSSPFMYPRTGCWQEIQFGFRIQFRRRARPSARSSTNPRSPTFHKSPAVRKSPTFQKARPSAILPFPEGSPIDGPSQLKDQPPKNLPRWCDPGSLPLFFEGAAPPSKIEKRYQTDRTARKAATQCVIQPATVNEWKISWKPNVFGLGSGHLRP